MSNTNRNNEGTIDNASLVFFNSLRVIAMICVIIYHAVASYSTIVPYWQVQDPTKDIFSDFIRYFFDVFIMAIFFFIAGYFGIKSLQKYPPKEFLKRKFRTLMSYWILVILVILPFLCWQVYEYDLIYSNYLEFWLLYLSSIGTITIAPHGSSAVPGPVYHMHFWFISLLFYFFIILMIIYYLVEKKLGNSGKENITPITEKSMFKTIILFTILISIGTFVMLLFFADFSWFNMNLIIQFQPTDIITYIGFFALGAYASAKKWFTNNTLPGRWEYWGIVTIVLTVLFFLVGGNIFTNPNSQLLNPGILFAFSFIRSFLCLSVIFFLLSLTMKYMNKPSFFNTELAKHSYNIYLLHLFIVIFFQTALLNWVGGPNIVKIIITTIATLFISYAISKYVFKKAPKITVFVIIILFYVLMLLASVFPILNEI
ncbi:MAG: acyltransferase family protein [Promethearchaeota archaeon]